METGQYVCSTPAGSNRLLWKQGNVYSIPAGSNRLLGKTGQYVYSTPTRSNRLLGKKGNRYILCPPEVTGYYGNRTIGIQYACRE